LFCGSPRGGWALTSEGGVWGGGQRSDTWHGGGRGGGDHFEKLKRGGTGNMPDPKNRCRKKKKDKEGNCVAR